MKARKQYLVHGIVRRYSSYTLQTAMYSAHSGYPFILLRYCFHFHSGCSQSHSDLSIPNLLRHRSPIMNLEDASEHSFLFLFCVFLSHLPIGEQSPKDPSCLPSFLLCQTSSFQHPSSLFFPCDRDKLGLSHL